MQNAFYGGGGRGGRMPHGPVAGPSVQGINAGPAFSPLPQMTQAAVTNSINPGSAPPMTAPNPATALAGMEGWEPKVSRAWGHPDNKMRKALGFGLMGIGPAMQGQQPAFFHEALRKHLDGKTDVATSPFAGLLEALKKRQR